MCIGDHFDSWFTPNMIKAIRPIVYEMGVPVAQREVTIKAKNVIRETEGNGGLYKPGFRL